MRSYPDIPVWSPRPIVAKTRRIAIVSSGLGKGLRKVPSSVSISLSAVRWHAEGDRGWHRSGPDPHHSGASAATCATRRCVSANAASRGSKRPLCRYLMVDTAAARCSLRQRKTAWANRPSGRLLQALAGFNHYVQYGFTLS